MKKTLRLVAVFALMGATLAYTGCTDYSKDFDDINNRIEALESGKLKSVEEQVAGLKSTVASLEDAKSKAEAAIAELQKNSATAADLKALEAKLDAAVKDAASKAAVEDLKSQLEKIEADLAKYAKVETLNAEVEKLNKAIADAKALSEKEFATVNDKIKAITDWQVEAVAKLGALEGQIKTLEEGLATSQQDIITLTEGLKSVSAATGILEDEVEKIYDELNIAWDRIRELTEGLRSTTAGLAIAEQDIIALQTDMADVKEALKALKEASAKHVTADDVKEAVKTAVAEAIANDGVISAEIAKAVKAATDKLQAQIDAVKNVVKNLTEQIQSIVYVPETIDGKMASNVYTLGTTFTSPVMVKATYEVTPRELVAYLTEEKLYASSVVVKAAPAEQFDVKVLSTDPTTGRIEVSIDIPAKTEASKALLNTTDPDCIALALNIVDSKITNYPGEDNMVDTGCKKSSTYVTVKKPVTVALNEVVKMTLNGKEVNSVNKEYRVYFDEADNKIALFEGYGIAWKIGGALMSKEEVEEFFGTNLKLSFKETIAYSKSGVSTAAAKTPIKLEGTNLEKTAKISPLTDVKGNKMVGYKATVKYDAFKINDVAVPAAIAFAASYEITNTVRDIVYPDEHIAWVYTNKNKVASFDTKANLEVEGLGDVVSEVALKRLVDGKETPKTTETAKVQAKDNEGDFTVTGKIRFENLVYEPGKEVVYVATYNITNRATNVSYAAICKVILAPMPANKEIDLGTIEVVRNFSSDYTTAIAPMNATYAEHSAYYPELTSEKNFRTAYLAESPNMLTMVVKADNAGIDNTGFNFTLSQGKNGETSKITLPKSASLAKYKTLVISQPVEVFGVTYTYKLTVNYKDPETYSLMTNPIRVDNNIATLGGTYKYGDMDNTKEDFALESIDLSTFFYVDGHKGSTEELQVKYSRITYNDKGNEITESLGTYNVNAGAVSIASAAYTWPGNVSSVIIRAELVMKNADFKFNSINVTLNAPKVISEFAGLTANKDVVDGVDATVNLFNYLSVVDFKGTQLVCSEATTIDNMWAWVDEEDIDFDTEELNPSAFHPDCYLIYGQTLEFADKSKITIKHNGTVIDPSLVNFVYNKDNDGKITLSKNNASLNGTITFEIPVKLGYIYNNGEKRPGTITVNYVRATDAE